MEGSAEKLNMLATEEHTQYSLAPSHLAILSCIWGDSKYWQYEKKTQRDFHYFLLVQKVWEETVECVVNSVKGWILQDLSNSQKLARDSQMRWC